MELFTTLSTRDVLSLVGLALVVITVYLRIKELHKNRFTYHTATLFLVESYGIKVYGYKDTLEGEVIRKCKKTGIWEFLNPKHGWKPLSNEKIEQVEKMLHEKKSIELIVDIAT
ncbi:MAG: hypothetical protein QG654_54 [Patescibacteria group bacterium]|nr:hypothetical protein [Patescibacteria group bacterium]